MMTESRLIILCFVVLTLLTGCGQSPRAETELEPLVCPASEQDQAFAAAQQAIKGMCFSIDVADRQAGYIRTLPLSGAQGFELWRSDSVGAFNALEANLHSIRRIAEISITAREDDLHINCTVETQRLNMPAREVTSSAQAYRIHSDSSKAIQKLKLTPAQERTMMWVSLGPDELLAQRILDRIRMRLSEAGISLSNQG